uniref:Membrane progestin receptor gamma n=1 Tax=Sepiella maindroni TaxID=153280 RepID=A0A2L0V7Q2_9MOLL|nr:membrane progestin receptor gamma [Sepiella maindroni]
MATRMVIGAKTSYHFRLMMKKIISCKSFEMISTYPLNGPLYHVDQIPAEFHESFILSGYRHPKSTFLQCVFSVFYRTNETGNFWTHFLPSCYFIYVICEKLSEDDYSLPFLAYLLACILFSLASSMAHMFFVLSDYARHICFFIDYGGLSLFSIGSAIAYRAYVFPEVLERTWFGYWYLPMAIFGALASTFFSCLSRFKKDCHTQQLLRIVAFSLPYLFDNLPVMVWLALCDFKQCLQSKFYHITQFMFCFIAAFLYMSHLPERLQPGRFDIWGHSHQIFHVCGILGTISQMKAIEIDMDLQKANIIKPCYYMYFHYSVEIMCAVLILNIIIIFIFSCMLKIEMKKKND